MVMYYLEGILNKLILFYKKINLYNSTRFAIIYFRVKIKNTLKYKHETILKHKTNFNYIKSKK